MTEPVSIQDLTSNGDGTWTLRAEGRNEPLTLTTEQAMTMFEPEQHMNPDQQAIVRVVCVEHPNERLYGPFRNESFAQRWLADARETLGLIEDIEPEVISLNAPDLSDGG